MRFQIPAEAGISTDYSLALSFQRKLEPPASSKNCISNFYRTPVIIYLAAESFLNTALLLYILLGT